MSEYYLTRDELYHHGILGQKWGLRRFQNEDGSLTAEGREHYGYGVDSDRSLSGRIRNAQYNKAQSNLRSAKSELKQLKDIEAYAKKNPNKLNSSKLATAIRNKQIANAEKRIKENEAASKELKEISDAKMKEKASPEYKARQEKMKKAAIAGAAIVGTALVAYGAYKLSQTKKMHAETGKKLVDYYTKKINAAETLDYKYRRQANIYERAARQSWPSDVSKTAHYFEKTNENLDKARRATNSRIGAKRALRTQLFK